MSSSNTDTQLLNAYNNARYFVDYNSVDCNSNDNNSLVRRALECNDKTKAGDKLLAFRIGQPSPALDELFKHFQANQAAFITAFNPNSQVLSTVENQARQRVLIKDIAKLNLPCLFGYSSDKEGSWPREESVMIINISEDNARLLKDKYQQRAIVWITPGAPPRLID